MSTEIVDGPGIINPNSIALIKKWFFSILCHSHEYDKDLKFQFKILLGKTETWLKMSHNAEHFTPIWSGLNEQNKDILRVAQLDKRKIYDRTVSPKTPFS